VTTAVIAAMSSLSVKTMRAFLARSISSLNRNKLNGLLAEVSFRAHLRELGFGDRVSRGGWIARRTGAGEFAHRTAVFFPETIVANREYSPDRSLPAPDIGLHTICATFHQSGIGAYFCAPTISRGEDPESINWHSVQLGLPVAQHYRQFPKSVESLFTARHRRYNFLRYDAPAESIPTEAIAEEFTKEHLRVQFQNAFMAQIADIDGILWGEQFTYPLEIKEKTPAFDRGLGEFFGLDVGPFVKLAYFAARRGNLHALFVVREIDHAETRNLVDWWFITFERLALFASWIFRAGGTAMGGGASSVVCIPKAEFQRLDREHLEKL
jgi:hypothetical protein